VLAASERTRLRSALESLHRVGVVHHAVDDAHVYRHRGMVFLAYPRIARGGGALDDDLAALDALGRGRSAAPMG
jgi:hypothetical protein